MDIRDALTQLNLTPREAQIYTALLELGQATPLTIANKTGLKRPTVYLDLEALRRKRLAGLSPKGRKSVYVAESPNRLVSQLQEQNQVLQTILPTLRALENKGVGKPVIRLYDQAEDIRRVYVTEVFQTRENLYISNLQKLDEREPGLLEEFEKHLQNGTIEHSREIVANNAFDIAYAKKRQMKRHQARVIPSGYQLEVDFSIWGNNVSLYSIDKHYLLVISDPVICNAFRALFELAWKVSRPVHELKKT